MNFNSKPFNGEKFNEQVLKRAGMWRDKEAPETPKNLDEFGKNGNKTRQEQATHTHMLTIPLSLNDPDQQSTFIGFRDTLMSDKKLELCSENQLTKSNFTFPSMLHLTFMHLDLSAPEKMDLAKKMLKEIETEF